MPQQMNLQDMLYVLEAVVLGAVIIFGYLFRRNRVKERISPSSFAFGNSAPFELAYAVETEISAAPSTEIVPGLFLYFNESDQAGIFYGQWENRDLSSENARYCLRIIQRDVKEVEWLSLERRLESNGQKHVENVRWLIVGKSNFPTEITLAMIVVGKDGQSERIELGKHMLSSGFQKLQLGAKVGENLPASCLSPKVFRFIILVEVRSGLCIDFEAWDIDFDEVQESSTVS